jgi:hypothetical protein
MASIIKADNIQKVSDGTNIIKKCGSTITLGSCGATISLAAGATQTGFGRTGTVDWCTTAKTAPFTGVSGNGYFVNTTCGAVTVTLPASPSAGDIVSLKDYANTWDTNAVTLCRNSSKINGACANAILNTESQSVTLIYVDGTKGWQDIQDSTANVTGNPGYTVASGGTETNSPCGNYKIHTFTADGPLNITNVGTPAGGTDKVSYMVVAGGGSGGGGCGGGGGAGGFREAKVPSDPYTDSPLDAGTGLVVSVADFTITVGGGGTGNPLGSPSTPGTSGSVSTFSTITSAGGGGGGGGPNAGPSVNGNPGGSGGGGQPGGPGGPVGAGGTGNTPPVSPPQGQNGGPGFNNPGDKGGGGGGAGAAGNPGTAPSGGGGIGGAGVTTSITASPVQRAGGGGGASSCGSSGCNGGAGGGGSGGYPGGNAVAGTINTGSGGGAGGAGPVPSGAGGSGIVVIRYKFQ